MLYILFNDTATSEIYTLSLHDALPISQCGVHHQAARPVAGAAAAGRAQQGRLGAARLCRRGHHAPGGRGGRSEEHTSELQSRQYLVCRLLLEKKKTKNEYEKTMIERAS